MWGGGVDYEVKDSLIAINQRHCQKRFFDQMSSLGKIAILVSSEREFIFGDGFFHNFTSSTDAPIRAKIIVPLTPRISLFYVRPQSYFPEPRVSRIELVDNEVKFLNDTVQIYSESQIFYRNDRPDLLDGFKQERFLEYVDNTHPIIERMEKIIVQARF